MTRTVAALFVTLAHAACQSSQPKTFVPVEGDDPEMEAAIARARSRLPEFWATLAKPDGASSFAVKVPLRDAGKTEWFWLIDLEREGGKVTGTLNNEPTIVHHVKEGQRLTVAESELADWMFMRSGKMHGNFTVRPLFKSMSPADVARIKPLLAEP